MTSDFSSVQCAENGSVQRVQNNFKLNYFLNHLHWKYVFFSFVLTVTLCSHIGAGVSTHWKSLYKLLFLKPHSPEPCMSLFKSVVKLQFLLL